MYIYIYILKQIVICTYAAKFIQKKGAQVLKCGAQIQNTKPIKACAYKIPDCRYHVRRFLQFWLVKVAHC